MKLLLSPLPTASGPQSLQKLVGALILTLSVSVHFFALGSKADLSLLAYDESESWQTPAELTTLTASEVLFAADSSWQKPALTTLGLTATTAFSLPATPTSPVATPATMPPALSQFEAALVALNFHY